MNIHERIALLPRARRGDETIILVSESELAEIIGDAQASEARLFERGGAAAFARRSPQVVEIHTSEPTERNYRLAHYIEDHLRPR